MAVLIHSCSPDRACPTNISSTLATDAVSSRPWRAMLPPQPDGHDEHSSIRQLCFAVTRSMRFMIHGMYAKSWQGTAQLRTPAFLQNPASIPSAHLLPTSAEAARSDRDPQARRLAGEYVCASLNPVRHIVLPGPRAKDPGTRSQGRVLPRW